MVQYNVDLQSDVLLSGGETARTASPLAKSQHVSKFTLQWLCSDAAFFPSHAKLLCKFLYTNAVLLNPQGATSPSRHRDIFCKVLRCLRIKSSYIKCTVLTMCLFAERQPSLTHKALCAQHYFTHLVAFKLFSFQSPSVGINSEPLV